MPLNPRRQSRLFMSVLSSTDPFQILNLSPTSDKKAIKGAYRRMALKYHPDVVTNQDTSTEARKKANDEFAQINWAYAQLSGKSGIISTTTSTSSSSTSSSSYSRPHRRTSSNTYNPYEESTHWREYIYDPFETSTFWKKDKPSYYDKQVCGEQVHYKGSDFFDKRNTCNPYEASTDWRHYTYNPYQESSYWRDYMYDPYQVSFHWRDGEQVYDEHVSDKGGDSVDKIISDVFKGAAFGAMSVGDGGRGIFRDFVAFLERTENDVKNEDYDAELRILLDTGSAQDVRREMEDAEYVVQQLDLNRLNLAEELIIVESYLAKMGLAQKVAEVEARKRVVDGNLQEARKWLSALQKRHKELLVRVDNDFCTGGYSGTKAKYVSHRVKYGSYRKLWNRFREMVSFTSHP